MAAFTPYAPNRFLITTPGMAGTSGVFPLLPGQGFFVEKTATWATGVQRAASGRERATKLWAAPIWTFKVAYEVVRNTPALPELQSLYAFFNLAAGKFSRWNFQDPTDYQVTGQPFGTGDGVTTQFQLVRGFSYAGQQWIEPVRSLNGAPTIYVNGAPTSAFTLGSYGAVTFTSAPSAGAALTWDGQFFFLCRFDQDKIDPAQLVQQLWSLKGLSFISVKP
jgi:uncharacterized protein (TIGR02217 family)